MKAIHLFDDNGRQVATVFHTPTGGHLPLLVTWQGRYFVGPGPSSEYHETFAWPVFTREDLETAKREGLVT